MREQDAVHLADPTLGVLDGAFDLVGPSGKPGVDQHHAVVDDNGKSIHVSDGDLNDAVGHFAHSVLSVELLPRLPDTRCPNRVVGSDW
jgi:hypothetical protein